MREAWGCWQAAALGGKAELAGGRTVTVIRNWSSDRAGAAFLRDVRDGACGLFSTVLSPDYNRAHADHLHVDQAARGEYGGRLCS